MKEYFKDIGEDQLLKRGFILNFSLIILSLLYTLLYFKNLPPYIPIFNQMPWGEQRIANAVWIFLIPALAFLIFTANLTFSSMFYKKSPLVSRLFSITSFLVSILAFLFIVRTVHTVY